MKKWKIVTDEDSDETSDVSEFGNMSEEQMKNYLCGKSADNFFVLNKSFMENENDEITKNLDLVRSSISKVSSGDSIDAIYNSMLDDKTLDESTAIIIKNHLEILLKLTAINLMLKTKYGFNIDLDKIPSGVYAYIWNTTEEEAINLIEDYEKTREIILKSITSGVPPQFI